MKQSIRINRKPLAYHRDRSRARARTRLRQLLLRKHRKCVISGWSNPLEIQMAHIIPKAIGYSIEYSDTDTLTNCILLSNGLHALFDNFQWTLDIFSFLDLNVESDEYFKTTLLIKKQPPISGSSISGCQNKIFKIPVQYYQSFYAHYYVYLQSNYTNRKDTANMFRECIDSPLFQHLKTLDTVTTIKEYLLSKRKDDDHSCTIILDHIVNNEDNIYKVLWHLWPLSYYTWEPRSNLSDSLHSQYEDHIEALLDPDWDPSTGKDCL